MFFLTLETHGCNGGRMKSEWLNRKRGRSSLLLPLSFTVSDDALLSDLGDVLGRWALLTLDDIELHLLAFSQ
jgi:hypothetical protein